MMKAFVMFYVVLTNLLLAACQTTPAAPTQEPIQDTRLAPTAIPELTPYAVVLPLPTMIALSEATDYVSGQSDVPAGSYLFVEYADVNT